MGREIASMSLEYNSIELKEDGKAIPVPFLLAKLNKIVSEFVWSLFEGLDPFHRVE